MGNTKKIQLISFQSLSAKSGEGMARIGFYLSAELHKRGLLKNFVVHSKGKYDTPFPSVPVSSLSRLYLFLLNKINRVIPLPSYKFRLLQEILFDWFCAFRIEQDTDMIFTTNAYLYRTFKRAKKLGIKIVLLPGTPEENYIYGLVAEENRKMQITQVDAYTYKKRIAYFNKSISYADKIIGSLPPVYTSYSNAKHPAEVIRILGHMKPDFAPVSIEPRPIEDSFKVGYLAHTVVLKGLQYLLEAWQQLVTDSANKHMELIIAGNIDPNIRRYLDERFKDLKQVKMIGHVQDVPEFVKSLDIFTVPSLIDGGPVTALEAAHYAVPVVITENSGSAELLGRNESGCWVVPIKDANALAETMQWAYNNRAATKQMGMNAKHNLDTYSMDDFIIQIADYLEHKA